MKPLDHSECDPAECIHRAAQDVAPQATEMHLSMAQGRQDKERYLRQHPAEARSEMAFDEAYDGPDAENEHYEQKRLRRLQAKNTRYGLNAEAKETTFGGVKLVVDENDGVYQRRQKLEQLELELLKAREDMVAHGDPLPLQDLRNVVGDALRLLDGKQRQYGDAWRKQGYMGQVARIKSKTDRLDNLLWRDADGNGYPLPANWDRDGETVVDTALDLINLAAMFVVNFTNENRWG